MPPVLRGHVAHLLDRTSGKGWSQRWAETYYDQHPALISEAEWRDLADHLRRPINKFQAVTDREGRHGLTGLLRCANCGHNMRRNSAAGVTWWRCRHRLCEERAAIKEEAALPAAIAAAVDAADRMAALAVMSPDEDPAIAAKRQDLEQLEQLAQRNASLAPAVAALREEINGMSRRPQASPDMTEAAARISDPEFFSGATPQEQRALLALALQWLEVDRAGAVRAQPRSW